MRRFVLPGRIGLLLLCGYVPLAAQQSRRCIAAKDLTVQALERVSASSPDSEVSDAVELLKRAISLCSNAGDAWYYRSVMEERLKLDPTFARGRAKLIGSEAMSEGLNPFVLATPPAASTQATAPAPLPQGTKWALVVGIGHFGDSSIDPLKYTAADAKLFAETLTNPSLGAFPADHVHLLLDQAASTKEIKANLNWIARQARPEDTVVVYIATHGSARDLDAVSGVNYLITADTELGPNQDQDALFGSALPMIDLVDTVATRIHSLQTAIFVDTCYSGAMKAGDSKPRANSLDTHTLEQIRQGSGRIIMTASRDDEESMQSDKLAHGYFTYYLAQALQKAPAQTLSQLFGSIQHNVSTSVATDFKAYHTTQTPVLSRSSDDADFALGQTVEPQEKNTTRNPPKIAGRR